MLLLFFFRFSLYCVRWSRMYVRTWDSRCSSYSLSVSSVNSATKADRTHVNVKNEQELRNWTSSGKELDGLCSRRSEISTHQKMCWTEKWLDGEKKRFRKPANRHTTHLVKKEHTISTMHTTVSMFNGTKSLYCVHPGVFFSVFFVSTSFNNSKKLQNYIKCSCSYFVEPYTRVD